MPDEACAHLAVTWKTDRTPDGETSGAWECGVCGQEFVPEVWVKEASEDDYRAGLEAAAKAQCQLCAGEEFEVAELESDGVWRHGAIECSASAIRALAGGREGEG